MERPNYYAIITADVRYDDRLCANAKLLYAEITALSHARDYCWASNGYFAKLYNVEVRTVQRWIEQLARFGYIKVSRVKETSARRQLIPLSKKPTVSR